MAIYVVLISSNSLDESVGTPTTRVILFGMIPTAILATVPIVNSHVVHDDTPLIPTETPTIPLVVSTLPHTSLFFTDSSDNDTSKRPPSQDPYKVTVARWRSRVATSSSPPPPPTLCQLLSAPSGLPRHSTPDSSFYSPVTSFAGPSRKRRRSPAVSVPLATPIPGALSLVRVDLLSPRKRIRGLVFMTAQDDSTKEIYEAYIEPDIDSNVQADIDADITAAEAAAAREAAARVEIDTRIDREDESFREVVQIGLDEIVHELHDHLEEIPVWRIRVIESVQIDQGRRMLVASQ
nr:hypothetical protein [Tanacetum cinerariifolium]